MRVPKSAPSASPASWTDTDHGPADDVSDHDLDTAPEPERIPDHVLDQWAERDRADDDGEAA